MALTTLTFDPASIEAMLKRGGPPSLLRATITLTGDESFTEAELSEPGGVSRWCQYPATMDHGVAAELVFDLRALRQTSYSTTIRATKEEVTTDLPVTIKVVETVYAGTHGRRR